MAYIPGTIPSILFFRAFSVNKGQRKEEQWKFIVDFI